MKWEEWSLAERLGKSTEEVQRQDRKKN